MESSLKQTFFRILLVLLLLIPASAFAAGGWKGGKQIRSAGNIGVGAGTGTFASGLSLKYFAGPAFAIQGNVGWWRSRWWGDDDYRWGGNSSLALSVDALLEQGVFAGNGDIDLAWNFGFGGGIGLSEYSDTIGAAASGVLGLEVLINLIPIDLVLEFRPTILLVPSVHFDLVDFTGHIRYYF